MPYNDGIGDVSVFLDSFERDVLEEQRFQALDIALRSMPACWWSTHKYNIGDWREYRQLMRHMFGYENTRLAKKYNGKDDPR